MKFKRILAAGMVVLCSVLPLSPAASVQGEGLVDSGIDYTELVGTVRTPGAGYTSTLAFRCKPGETKAYNPTGDLTLLFVDIGGFSSGSNGTTDSDGNHTPARIMTWMGPFSKACAPPWKTAGRTAAWQRSGSGMMQTGFGIRSLPPLSRCSGTLNRSGRMAF